MDPFLLRGGFRIGFFIVAVALASLPFQSPGSAEFVVTILAAAVGASFLAGIALLARVTEARLPDDKHHEKGYNERSIRRGR